VQIPQPFHAFVELIETKLNIEFPKDLQFTLEEVVDSDKECIERFSTTNFDYSKLNLGYLVKAAIMSARELGIISDGKYEMLSIKESLNSFQGGTSAGYPTFKLKKTDVARDDAENWTTDFMSDPRLLVILKQVTAVFHRFQYKYNIKLNKLQKKIRQVWGLSFRVLVLEGVFFRDMVNGTSDYCSGDVNPVCTWGRSLPNISRLIIPRLRSFRKRIISIDIEKFDQGVPSFMWAMFYAIVFDCIEDAHKYKVHLKQLMIFDNYTPYCWRSTKIQFQKRGIPSGSLKTQLFGTFVNRTIMNYAFLEYSGGTQYAGSRSCGLGDDIVVVEDGITFSHIRTVYKRFGMTVSEEKSAVTEYNEDFSFIGYIWDSENRPIQYQDWYVAHFCLPSRFYRTQMFDIADLQTYRAISMSMVLYKGMENYEHLIGWGDFVYARLLDEYARGIDPCIYYVGEDQRQFGLKIPLSLVFNEGWTAFG